MSKVVFLLGGPRVSAPVCRSSYLEVSVYLWFEEARLQRCDTGKRKCITISL